MPTVPGILRAVSLEPIRPAPSTSRRADADGRLIPDGLTSSPRLSVVVPCFRQQDVIAENLREIIARVESLGVEFEVVLVSDGSPDDTERQAGTVDDPRVRVLAYDRNMGKGYAIRTGSLAARGEWVAWVDSDLDLDPSLLEGFLSMAEERHLDVVVGSKRHPDSLVDYPTKRRVYSWLYQRLVKVLFRLDIRDTQVGMKLFRRSVLEEVLPVVVVKRYAFDLEILAVARSFGIDRIAEAPVRLDYRFSGTGINWRAIAHALWDTAAVFYRLRLLGYYDQRRVLAHRLAVHRPATPPTVTVIVAPGPAVPEDAAAQLDAILDRLPASVEVTVISPPSLRPHLNRPERVRIVEPRDGEQAATVHAARGATTDVVAFLDLGGQPTGHWLDSALPLFGDPMIAAVAGPTVPVLTGDLQRDATGLLSESRLGMGGARVRHHVGGVREVGDFPLQNLFVRTDIVRTLTDAGVPLDDQFITALRRRLGLSVLCSPDVVVSTLPPPLWSRHIRRLYRLAMHRGRVAGPDLPLRLRHLVPLAWTLTLAGGPLALARGGRIRRSWLAVVLTYGAVIAWFASLTGILHRRPRLGVLTAAGAAASHLTVGLGLIIGRIRRFKALFSR